MRLGWCRAEEDVRGRIRLNAQSTEDTVRFLVMVNGAIGLTGEIQGMSH